jgi:hypothetical protein
VGAHPGTIRTVVRNVEARFARAQDTVTSEQPGRPATSVSVPPLGAAISMRWPIGNTVATAKENWPRILSGFASVSRRHMPSVNQVGGLPTLSRTTPYLVIK